MASQALYQPMAKFLGRSDHLNISSQLIFLIISANFQRWFLQTEFRFSLSNLLRTYDRIVGSFLPLSYYQPTSIFGYFGQLLEVVFWKPSLNLTFLTFYQLIIQFLDHSDHLLWMSYVSHSNRLRFELRPTVYKNKEVSHYDQSIYRWSLDFRTSACGCELCKRLILGLDNPGSNPVCYIDWYYAKLSQC